MQLLSGLNLAKNGSQKIYCGDQEAEVDWRQRVPQIGKPVKTNLLVSFTLNEGLYLLAVVS